MMTNQKPSTPKWFAAIIVILLLPLGQFPYLLNLCQEGSQARVFLWIYPFYALLSGYLAYICYPQRRLIAWILLLLLIMSHLSIWWLITTPLPQ